MSLVVNHNLMAMSASRYLNVSYTRLSTSVTRLASGLRINSAADDAAGLAIREMMRTDIRVLNQGVRNANDAMSLIQTADGALSVIDEKLTRMKELAEQAATGTYTITARKCRITAKLNYNQKSQKTAIEFFQRIKDIRRTMSKNYVT